MPGVKGTRDATLGTRRVSFFSALRHLNGDFNASRGEGGGLAPLFEVRLGDEPFLFVLARGDH